MDLKRFHILFISLATLCCVGFGLWCFTPSAGGGIGAYAGGGAGIVLGFATAVYGMWFYRNKIRTAGVGANRNG